MHEVAAHAREAHPDDVRSDEEIRTLVAERAEEPPDRPPWAYRPRYEARASLTIRSCSTRCAVG